MLFTSPPPTFASHASLFFLAPLLVTVLFLPLIPSFQSPLSPRFFLSSGFLASPSRTMSPRYLLPRSYATGVERNRRWPEGASPPRSTPVAAAVKQIFPMHSHAAAKPRSCDRYTSLPFTTVSNLEKLIINKNLRLKVYNFVSKKRRNQVKIYLFSVITLVES